MTRIAQKEREVFYLQEFLHNELKLEVLDMKPALHDPPDCCATIRTTDGMISLVDYELSEYYVDLQAEDGRGSPTMRLNGFWNRMQDELLVHLRTLKLPVHLNVRLRDPRFLTNRHVRQLSDELIRFAQEHCPSAHMSRICHRVFPGSRYPLLRKQVEWIFVTRMGESMLYWDCSNLGAANIGVDIGHLTRQVVSKSTRRFSWRSGAERCLLLYASGGVPTSRAGPPPPDESIWDDMDLIGACQQALFDRIYFWERVRRWHKRLK